MAMPAEAKDHGEGYVRVATLGFHTGALHTGHAICELAPGGIIEPHPYPYEQSFYPESCANTRAQERKAIRERLQNSGDSQGLGLVPKCTHWVHLGTMPKGLRNLTVSLTAHTRYPLWRRVFPPPLLRSAGATKGALGDKR